MEQCPWQTKVPLFRCVDHGEMACELAARRSLAALGSRSQLRYPYSLITSSKLTSSRWEAFSLSDLPKLTLAAFSKDLRDILPMLTLTASLKIETSYCLTLTVYLETIAWLRLKAPQTAGNHISVGVLTADSFSALAALSTIEPPQTKQPFIFILQELDRGVTPAMLQWEIWVGGLKDTR